MVGPSRLAFSWRQRLPYADHTFDVALASLVVGFLADPVAGVGEMRRVTRPGGRLALCFWQLDRMPLLGTFWRAVGEFDRETAGDTGWLGRRAGELVGLLEQVGATDVLESDLAATATYADFEDWWSSFAGGAGPVGAYQQAMTEERRALVRDRCDDLLGRPRSTFTMEAHVWCAVGTA